MINATVVGRLTRDPEQRQAGQYNLVNFTVASNRTRKNKDGQYDASFIRCTVFGQRGDVILNSFSKGQPIIVSGELYINQWQDQQSQDHQSLEMEVSNFSFVPRDKYQGQAPQQQNEAAEVTDNDLPF
ncbi:single-stranded DNA-binding protein [Limosilactobacillus sp.]|jgi:single-strand DNA-binding protein|uniref:single-stranded DNA-binding protein n=1 Tax=Limosilactobacillus sp. TaxID=2773925 RepID=UPI0025BD58A0|nr:single-stranded DNA-binding protein [Limosilactobacillus sp.]MCH3922363.1 single-stranded DNA-binding protein [Limosilactobacillus sp.]MCH3929135.1 single-stranded DNA-binding protein [Limosilactobacillus sp.]